MTALAGWQRKRAESGAGASSGFRRLIVSADDFGMSPGVNAAVIRAHREGILTQTSLLVNGRAAAEAVRLAKENPGLAVGLHLALVQAYPVSAPREVPLLMGRDGVMRTNPVWAGIRYFFTPGGREQVRREIEAQLARFHDTGLPLSHVDGHLTVHMHPLAVQILVELAERYRIRAVRLPNESLREALRFDRRHLLRKSFEATVFRGLGRWARPRFDAARIRYADRVVGMHQTGHVTEEYLLAFLPTVGPGLTEIYCHAGCSDDESRRWRPADYDPEGELAALLSPRVRGAIERFGIELTNFEKEAKAERPPGS